MTRKFMFLQGPHGPFFAELASDLKQAGCDVMRVGFNRGDAYYWRDTLGYQTFQHGHDRWAKVVSEIFRSEGITDLVLYGDMRPVHRCAVAAAKKVGIRVHCFEEGYLRPYWATYERGGSNGNSRLMEIGNEEIAALLGDVTETPVDAPAIWGALWSHSWYGCIYHANILFRNHGYPNFQTHREISVFQEWALHVKRLLALPMHMAARRIKSRGLLRSGRTFHVALLQLGHDSAICDHSDVASMGAFIRDTIEAFKKGAPGHHALVFKAHPLEDGREPLGRIVRETAVAAGMSDRVWYIEGGRLGPLLDRAQSAITVNSTAGQQVLWRGMPLKALGRAIYDKPGFTSAQKMADFFMCPDRPDVSAYRRFRQFLLATSQLPGGFYTRAGRAALRRQVVDLMLRDCDPYDSLRGEYATDREKFRVVDGGKLDRSAG